MPRAKSDSKKVISVDPQKQGNELGAKHGGGRADGQIGTKKVEILEYIRENKWKTPLEYLLGVMNNEEVPRDSRIDAAKAAAPFVHAKLQAIQIESPNDSLDAEIKTEYRDALRAMKNGGPPPPPSN